MTNWNGLIDDMSWEGRGILIRAIYDLSLKLIAYKGAIWTIIIGTVVPVPGP